MAFVNKLSVPNSCCFNWEQKKLFVGKKFFWKVNIFKYYSVIERTWFCMHACQGTFNRRIPACCFLFLKDSLFLISSYSKNK